MTEELRQDIIYDEPLEQLFKEEAEKAEALSILHREAHNKYNLYTNLINIPVIVLSSIVGFGNALNLSYSDGYIVWGGLSVGIGIIKALDSYFQLGKRAETHRIVSLQYIHINRRISIELRLNRSDRVLAKDLLNIIRTDLKNLEEIAPMIEVDIIKKFNIRYKNYTNTTRPNITNGLSAVIINKNSNSPINISRPNSPVIVNMNDNDNGELM